MIIPNDMLGGMRGGGPTINVSVNAEAGVSEDEVRGFVVEGMHLARRAAYDDVLNDRGRPSALRQRGRP